MAAWSSLKRLSQVAAAAAISAALAAPASAAIASGSLTGGTAFGAGGTFVELTDPLGNPFGAPNSVGDDTFQSSNLYGFDEVQNYVLTAPLTLDSGTLPAGTVISSHFIFFDPGPVETAIGTVEFSSDILGLITHQDDLTASNNLGLSDVTYLDPTLVGLEPWNDVTISAPNQISIDTRAFTPGDYFRVITVAIPVPEPVTWALMIAAFAALGVALRQRRFAR